MPTPRSRSPRFLDVPGETSSHYVPSSQTQSASAPKTAPSDIRLLVDKLEIDLAVLSIGVRKDLTDLLRRVSILELRERALETRQDLLEEDEKVLEQRENQLEKLGSDVLEEVRKTRTMDNIPTVAYATVSDATDPHSADPQPTDSKHGGGGTSSSMVASYLASRFADLGKKLAFQEHPQFNPEEHLTTPDATEIDLTPAHLELGDTISMAESVWDATVFVFDRCLGLNVSLILVIVLLASTVLQLLFCGTMFQFMLESPVDDKKLDQLVRFRVSVAHSAEFMHETTRQSLASQVCEFGLDFPYAGLQSIITKDIDDFREGGLILMVLALCFWVLRIMNELNDTVQFIMGLQGKINMKKGTILVVTNSETTMTRRVSGAGPSNDLFALLVVVRVVSISMRRFCWAAIGIAAPRVFVAVLLGFLGILYLANTANLEELILNTVALEFVLSVDNVIFKVLAPRRVQCLISNLEPLPLLTNRGNRLKRMMGLASMGPILKIAIHITIMSLVYEFLVDPFFDRLFLAHEILCGGEKDFIYAPNQATGLIHVTKTPDSGDSVSWTASESTVFQTAGIDLQRARPKSLWKFDVSQWSDTINEKSQAWDPSFYLINTDDNRSAAIIEPRDADGTRAPSLEAVLEASASSINFIERLGRMDTKSAVNTLPCLDMQAGPSPDETLAELRSLVGNSDAPPCYASWFYERFCHWRNMTRLRALCPIACECHFPLSAASGHFGTQAYGCPTACAVIARSAAEQMLQAGITHPYYLRPCSNVKPHTFYTDDLMRNWLPTYMEGVAETVMTNPDRIQTASFLMNTLGLGGMPVLEGLRSGTFFSDIARGRWRLAEGIPHPRGLTGCDFLSSWELAVILGADLCDTGEFRSIRFFCPRACGCHELAEVNGEECPITCYQGTSQECADLLRVSHAGSPEYNGIYHKTYVKDVYPNMGGAVYVNSNGKYVFPWKHNSEDYGHWMVGDTWSAPVYNMYASDGANCPDDADWNDVDVEKVTCPLMVQVQAVGASMTLPLGVYTVIDTLKRRVRPLYSRNNISYLYYWQPTQQWLIGYGYTDASAVVASINAKDAPCPTHASGWAVTGKHTDGSRPSVNVSTYYVTDWRFSFDGYLDNAGSTSASPRQYGQLSFGDGVTENTKSLHLPGNYGTFVDLGPTAVGDGSFSVCGFIKRSGGQVILDMAGTPPGVQGQMAYNIVVAVFENERGYDEEDEENEEEDEGKDEGDRLVFMHVKNEVPVDFGTWDEQVWFAMANQGFFYFETGNFIKRDTWVHFCISVSKDGRLSVYKNGRLHDSNPHFSTMSPGIRWESYLGACHWWLSESHEPVIGDIQQLTIRTEEVTEAEAAALYGNGRGNASFFR